MNKNINVSMSGGGEMLFCISIWRVRSTLIVLSDTDYCRWAVFESQSKD